MRGVSMSKDRLHELECRACPLNFAANRHPKMAPTGAEHPAIYILGEAPGETEDRVGRQFIGKAGQRLRREIPREWVSRIRWNNTIRDRPPENRDPSPVEIECCRPSIEADIVAAKPKVLLALGAVPVTWFGVKGGISLWRGRCFPARVTHGGQSHDLWVLPTFHPSYVAHVEDGHGDGESGELAQASAVMFGRDLDRAFRFAEKPPRPRILTRADLPPVTMLYRDSDIDRIPELLEPFLAEDVVAFDIESTHLRPFSEGARLVSIAFADTKRSVAMSLGHPGASERFNAAARRVLGWFLRRWVRTSSRKPGHNTQLDLEWLRHAYGLWVLGCPYDDTQAQAFVLDERPGALSLDVISVLNFGLHLKELSNVDVERLVDFPIEDVLTYNGFDAGGTALNFEAQNVRLDGQGLRGVYDFHRLRINSLVEAQTIGMPVDRARVLELQAPLHAKVEKAIANLNRLPSVKTYVRRFGPYNPGSNPQTVRLLRDVMGRDECKTDKGWSVDDAVLARIDHPVTRLLQRIREAGKLDTTYLEPHREPRPTGPLYPDGRLHTWYNHTLTATSRLSSEKPNNQNWPKREHREIRSVVVPPPRHRILSIDYGQIDWRVIVMLSEDPKSRKALMDRWDIHQYWAEQYVKLFPAAYKRAAGDDAKAKMKDVRAGVKNQFVFPKCYTAGAKTCARHLKCPIDVAQRMSERFEDEHAEIIKWQDTLLEFYERHGHVRLPTGRRRRGPLTRAMCVNTPVQGGSAEIVADAMGAILFDLAIGTDRPWLAPFLNVHDDLSFFIPRGKEDEAMAAIVPVMLRPRFKWINVPIMVEASIGDDWFSLEEVGKHYSDDLPVDEGRRLVTV